MTSRLVKATIGGTSRVVDVLAPASVTKNGTSQGYAGSPYSAWTAMWGTGVPGNESMTYTVSLRAVPSQFPAGTRWTYSITPDPDYSGVNGYLHVDYGNYDDSAGSITPRQVKDIATLTATVGWSVTGDPSGGLLAELWLSPVSAVSGPFAKTYEVGFMPYVSAEVAAWAATLPTVGTGSFVDGNGVTWNVRHTGAAQDYFVAYRPGYASFQGALPFRDYLTFLAGAGIITGNEWVNGLAFGVEPRHGAGTFTVNQFSVAYS